MADIFDELIGGGVSPELLAAELRRQMEYGTVASASGSKRLAPVGGAMREQALGLATDAASRREHRADKDQAGKLAALQAAFQAQEKAADRKSRESISAQNRALQRELTGSRIAAASGLADKRIEADKAKAAAKAGAQAPDPAALQNDIDFANTLAGKAKDAAGRVNMFTAGLGSLTSAIPGSPAADLEALLEPLQSNIAFDKLRELKEKSKTGASGLGSVTEREIDLLMNNIVSLRQKQSPAQLRKALGEIEQHFGRLSSQLAEGASRNAASAAPSAADPLDAMMQQLLESDPALAEMLEGSIE
jgi:hypothetical protein